MMTRRSYVRMMWLGAFLCLPYVIYFIILGNRDPIGSVAIPLTMLTFTGIGLMVYGAVYKH